VIFLSHGAAQSVQRRPGKSVSDFRQGQIFSLRSSTQLLIQFVCGVIAELERPEREATVNLNPATKQKLVAFSPQANYSDWATATGQLILVPAFVDRGMSFSKRGGSPTVVNLSFLDRSRYFFFQVAPHLSLRGWVNPVTDPLLLRNSDTARNRTRDLWVRSQELWPLDHRGGRALFAYFH
jgi:hypothetical protein